MIGMAGFIILPAKQYLSQMLSQNFSDKTNNILQIIFILLFLLLPLIYLWFKISAKKEM